jgi:iron(III) transport system substrate-binding protein
MVKGHPGYSGTIMTATHQLAKALGWGYFEKLSKQKVLQVQSATEPPKRIEAGERAIAVDGSDYLFWMAKERGAPIEVVHAVEGTPQIANPMAVFKSAPNPNAARLLAAWIMSAEGQEFIVNLSGQYPAHKLVKAKAGRPALASIKTLPEDPVEVEKTADEIKTRYQRLFKV